MVGRMQYPVGVRVNHDKLGGALLSFGALIDSWSNVSKLTGG